MGKESQIQGEVTDQLLVHLLVRIRHVDQEDIVDQGLGQKETIVIPDHHHIPHGLRRRKEDQRLHTVTDATVTHREVGPGAEIVTTKNANNNNISF